MLDFLAKLKNAWLLKVVKVVAENVPVLSPVLKFIDGHKTTIGRVLMGASALLLFVTSPQGLPAVYPELLTSHPEVMKTIESVLAGIGWLMTEFGLQHASAKAIAEEGAVKDISL